MLYCKLRTLIVIYLVISRLLNFISKLVVTNSQFIEEAEEHYFLMFFSIMLPLPAPPKNYTLASLFPASFIRVLLFLKKITASTSLLGTTSFCFIRKILYEHGAHFWSNLRTKSASAWKIIRNTHQI